MSSELFRNRFRTSNVWSPRNSDAATRNPVTRQEAKVKKLILNSHSRSCRLPEVDIGTSWQLTEITYRNKTSKQHAKTTGWNAETWGELQVNWPILQQSACSAALQLWRQLIVEQNEKVKCSFNKFNLRTLSLNKPFEPFELFEFDKVKNSKV